MKSQTEGIFGAVLGQAIGDAMGSQTEFRKGNKVSDLGPTWGYNYPAFSDDTQMALAIAESILAFEPYPNIEDFMDVLGKNFVTWYHGTHPNWGRNDRAPGGTCNGGCRALEVGTPWTSSGSKNGGKGNGSAMRASVIGAAYCLNPMYAFMLGCLTSVPTHNNLEAILAAGGVSFLVARSINNVPFPQAVHELINIMSDLGNVPDEALAKDTTDQSQLFCVTRISAAFAASIARMDFDKFRSYNGNDGKGLEALAAAIYYNARACRFSDVIVNAANHAGDSDSVAAIAGAIAGARWGFSFIPSKWRKRVEQTKYLHELAARFCEFSVKVFNVEEGQAESVATT
jgi:ADP-ribosylglycohydrolase